MRITAQSPSCRVLILIKPFSINRRVTASVASSGALSAALLNASKPTDTPADMQVAKADLRRDVDGMARRIGEGTARVKTAYSRLFLEARLCVA